MTDCICGFGKGLPDGQATCPYCGTDLSLLKKIGALPGSYVRRGEKLLRAGRTEEAVRALETAAALDPASAALRRALAEAYAERGEHERALRLYDEALGLDPGDEGVRDARAKAQEAAKRTAAERDKKRVRHKALIVLVPAAAFIIGLLFAPAAGLTGPGKGGAAAVMPPAEIEASLARCASLEGADIAVESEGGALKVRGVVPDERTREFVKDVVENGAGGRRVDLGELKVSAPSPGEIAERIETGIAGDPALAGSDVTAAASGGAVVLSGTAPEGSRDALAARIALEAGNAGVAVIADVTYGRGAAAYTVKAGDTLYSIARRFYGDGNGWTRIYEANRGLLAAPGSLETGMELTVPAK
ncbi:MAG: LysM peptidoglycan-binding domain-containing protein [Clostridiales bacterium]|jgi:nucleoid-associated protein YgaU|nr:LysM peptidoglycan-binding domain-containing protein [Clostridiales bacterium]